MPLSQNRVKKVDLGSICITSNKKIIIKCYSKFEESHSILEVSVSLVIRRSLSNVIRNLKKAVRFGDYFEIFVSCSDVIKSKFGQKDSNPYFVCQRL